MKWLKRTVSALLIPLLLYGIGRLTDVGYGSYVFVERQPYLQLQTPHGITVKWQTPERERGCVELFGAAESRTQCEPKPGRYHRIVFEHLKPGTRYGYRVRSDSLDIDNDGRFFTTLQPPGIPLQTVWVIGDSGQKGIEQSDVYHAMLRRIGGRPLDLWMLLGDNAYSSGSQKQYNASLFGPYGDLIKYLVPWAVIGNHDARRQAFYRIWDLPKAHECGGIASGSEKFYAVETGNLHCVMLDSQTTDLSAGGEMAQWLERDLAAAKTPWIIVAFHHPPYSHGGHNSDDPHDSGGRMEKLRRALLPILEKYDVDLVLSGHSHGYERSRLMHRHYGSSESFDPAAHLLSRADHTYRKSALKTPCGGTIYTVAGSASKRDRAPLDHPAMPFSFRETGSLLLQVTPTRLKAEFITDGGRITDWYEIIKRDSPVAGKERKL